MFVCPIKGRSQPFMLVGSATRMYGGFGKMVVSLNGDGGPKAGPSLRTLFYARALPPSKRLYIILKLGTDRTSEAETENASSSR